MKKLKITVVGVGIGGKIHIQSLKSNDFAVLDSIVAPARNLNYEISKKEQVPIFHTIEDCIRTQKPDGIVIASPNRFHEDHAKTCIKYKIPILIEKPITSCVNEGLELCELIEKTRAKVLIGHHRAYNPILTSARSVINQGRLGEIVSVMGSAQFYKPDYYFDDGPWRKMPGGGPILINMIHEIDNLRRLVGEISHVQAIASNKIRKFPVEDTVVINFVFKNNALGSFVLSDTAATSRSWEQTTQENLAYPSYPNENCYLISGTKGSLAIPTMVLKYYPDNTPQSWWTPFSEETINFSRANPIDLQLNHFLDVIKGRSDPMVTAYDGYKNLLISEAIRESANKNLIIEIK